MLKKIATISLLFSLVGTPHAEEKVANPSPPVIPTIEEQFDMAMQIRDQVAADRKAPIEELRPLFARVIEAIACASSEPNEFRYLLIPSTHSSTDHFVDSPTLLHYCNDVLTALKRLTLDKFDKDGNMFANSYKSYSYGQHLSLAYYDLKFILSLGIMPFPIVSFNGIVPERTLNKTMARKIGIIGGALYETGFDETKDKDSNPAKFADHDLAHILQNLVTNSYKAFRFAHIIIYLYETHSKLYQLLEASGLNTLVMERIFFQFSHEDKLYTIDQAQLLLNKEYDKLPQQPSITEEFIRAIVEKSKTWFAGGILYDKRRVAERLDEPSMKDFDWDALSKETFSLGKLMQETMALEVRTEKRRDFDPKAFSSNTEVDTLFLEERTRSDFINAIAPETPLWTAEGVFNDKAFIPAVHKLYDQLGDILVTEWKKKNSQKLLKYFYS